MINESMIVEKSRNVVTMQCLNMGEQELKILDVYLSRINPRDKSTREVEITKKEYEELIGIEEIQRARFRDYVHHLMQNIVSIPKGDGESDERTLFPNAKIRKKKRSQNDKVGVTTVILAINPELDEYFFDIKNLGYIKYRLKNIIKLNGKFEIKLYLLLKMYEYKGEEKEVEFTLKTLKDKTECYSIVKGKKQYKYKATKDFQYKMLKPAIQNINDFTDLNVSYEKPRKKSYEEEKIIFTVARKSKEVKVKLEPKASAPTPEKQLEITEPKIENNSYNLPLDVIQDEIFDIDVILLKIKGVYPSADDKKIKSILKRINLNYRPENVRTTPFSYYFGILRKFLEQELINQEKAAEKNKPKKPNPKGFDNFEQRDTDYDAIYAELNRQKNSTN